MRRHVSPVKAVCSVCEVENSSNVAGVISESVSPIYTYVGRYLYVFRLKLIGSISVGIFIEFVPHEYGMWSYLEPFRGYVTTERIKIFTPVS